MAFTDYETEQLRKALLKETRRCAVTLGMKKTSVDRLTKAVGIAKGSLYKFYESKEMLFLRGFRGNPLGALNVADRALSENGGVPPSERTAKAVLAVCKRLSDTGDMVFIENDAKLLLQRLPEPVKREHYHDGEAHIRELLEKHDLVPKRGVSLAAATVRGLILTVSPQGADRGSCTRRRFKRWYAALAGSYLNKTKCRRGAAFSTAGGWAASNRKNRTSIG